MCKYRIKKSIVIPILIIIILAAAAVAGVMIHSGSIGKPEKPLALQGPYSSQECDMLAPERVTDKNCNNIERKTIDFAESEKVSPRGYGFKKKVVFSQKTIFHMELMEAENMRNKNFVYGIYKDELLTAPVAENHMKLAFDLDEIHEKDIQIDYTYGICEVLQPGTYYIGMYAQKLDSEQMKETFVTDYAYLREEYSFDKNRKAAYFTYYEKGNAYFRLAASKTGKIKVSAEGSSIQLCDENKTGISDTVSSRTTDNGMILTGEFLVESNKEYFIKVTQNNPPASAGAGSALYPSTISYYYVE